MSSRTGCIVSLSPESLFPAVGPTDRLLRSRFESPMKDGGPGRGRSSGRHVGIDSVQRRGDGVKVVGPPEKDETVVIFRMERGSVRSFLKDYRLVFGFGL